MGTAGSREQEQQPEPQVRARRHSRRDRYTDAEKQRALALVGTMSYREIAKRVDPHCSPGTICRWVKENEKEIELQRRLAQARRQLETEQREREAAAIQNAFFF